METKTTYRIERHQLVAGTERQWSICRTATAITSLEMGRQEVMLIKENDPKTPIRLIKIEESIMIQE